MMRRVLEFWFKELDRRDWFRQSSTTDDTIRRRFEAVYWAVYAGETAHWRATPSGRLAEILVLDQFARNMFRGTAQAFAADPVALILAQELVRSGADHAFTDEQKNFAYMPFMHSESVAVHEQALALFEGLPAFRFEQAHKDIIDRFGRYPHRNQALGRASTDEEIEFMKTHSGF